MGWLIALGVLTLLAILPIGVSALYDGDGPRAFVQIGPARIRVYPAKPKEKKTEKPEKPTKKPKKQGKPAEKNRPAQKGGSLLDFLPLLDLILDFLSAFHRKLRVTCLELKLILAGDDPADLAQNYGKAWIALGNLTPLLNNGFTIKKQNLEVECDFEADSTTVIARLDLSITLGRILLLATVRVIPVLRELLKILKSRKGGAKA